jgi:peroxiredoxin
MLLGGNRDGTIIMSLEQILGRLSAADLPLQTKLDQLRTEFETNLAPPDVVAGIHRATEELIASGAGQRALKAGDQAPAFVLPDADGHPTSSRDLLLRGPVVVTFYRGIWCPYCTFDLQALEAARPQIEARCASLIAISQQTPANSRKSQRQNGLGFPILVDKGGSVAAQFGLRWNLPDHLRDIHKRLGADLTQFNGEDSWTLPMPARYVIDTNGTVAYAEINPDYTRRPEPSDVFPILDRMKVASCEPGRLFERSAAEPR